MGTSFKTRDELYTPPPVKGAKRRRSPWWLLLLLICCAAGVWWVNRDRTETTEIVAPRPMPTREPEGVQPVPPPAQLKADAPFQPSLPVVQPKDEKKQPPTVASDSGKTNAPPRPTSPMERPAVTPPAVVAQPTTPPKEKPTATPVERPIMVQLKKATDSLQMLLHIPRNERDQTLQKAASSRSEVDVLVVAPDGDGGRIGRARVTALREDGGVGAIAVLEFIRMPELDALVLLTNARLSPGARLVIVLEGGLKLEYQFSSGAGTLEAVR